ncbi:ribosomal biogenesis protein LAS1L isoform X2 [Mauremys mutica]|uniref:ribosomal biogenesis protein LAS1L isoform X2 n=1 Tax=Mauremys mutica TaxID=74926 RepID=UPI001D168372|nr:ribosomal biogenesis protein LAS1L isoform X2 [Mauremys mutica]
MAGSGARAEPGGRARARGQRPPRRSVVAWRSKAEWDQVMVGLYCGDCRLQRDALDRVSGWRSRYGHRMPLAVDCTADLIRCKILDTSGNLRSHELVLSYGLALVRFVNLITERKQKIVNIPLRRLAKEMNIPIWIVNLRHDLTHGKLPQLVACRKGCDVVLEWLRRTYWSRQLGNSLARECEEEQNEELETAATETEMDSDSEEAQNPQPPGYQKHKELHEKVRELLVSYKNQQFGVLQELQSLRKARKAWCNSSSEVEWILAQIKDLLQESREVVAEALLDDGSLIPTVEQLETLNIKCEENKQLLDFKIPQTFYYFWQPLLKGLQSRNFTQTLLEKMFADLKQCSESSEHRPQYLINWVAEILTANTKAKARRKVRRLSQSQINKRKLFHRRVSLQWIKLIDECLEAPCWATPHLLQRILSDMEPPLPSDAQENLLYLSSIYTQEGGSLSSPGSSSDSSGQPIYTTESLQWKARQESQAKGHRVERRETVLGGVGEEEDNGEEEAEEEEMEAEPTPFEELLHVDNMMVIAEKRAALHGSIWQITADGVQWKDFPLGKLPGQTDDPDSLLVDSYSMMSMLDQPVTRGDGRNSPSTK